MKANDLESRPITCLARLLSIADKLGELFHARIWWRGQSDFSWDLVPGAYRGVREISDKRVAETRAMIDFRRLAPARHRSCPDHSDLASWLFLAQHRRLPTRLLDWTESAMVGLYFAVEDKCRWGKRGSLWALNPFWLNRGQYFGGKPLALDLVALGPRDRLVKPAFEPHMDDNKHIFALLPREVDPRMTAQMAGFTIHGQGQDLSCWNHPKPSPQRERFLFQFRIPDCAKKRLKRSLRLAGIRERSVFPDLEGLVRDLKEEDFPR